MSGNIKSSVVCIVILSIFGCAFLSALILPSGADTANGSRIYGTILDMNGHGVDQATVKLIDSNGMAPSIPDNPTYSGDGKTNPYGFYQFNGSYSGTSTIIGAGTYQVTVSKDGHSGSATITVNGNDPGSINVVLSDYVQPSVTPVPTATPIPTALHHASVTVIEAPPTVIRPVVTVDANATAEATQVSNATNMTASSTPIPSAVPSNATPSPGSFMGTFTFSTLAVIGTMAIAVSRKDKKP